MWWEESQPALLYCGVSEFEDCMEIRESWVILLHERQKDHSLGSSSPVTRAYNTVQYRRVRRFFHSHRMTPHRSLIFTLTRYPFEFSLSDKNSKFYFICIIYEPTLTFISIHGVFHDFVFGMIWFEGKMPLIWAKVADLVHRKRQLFLCGGRIGGSELFTRSNWNKYW